MRPQAGGIFDKSGARRTRRHPTAGALPETSTESAAFEISTAACEIAPTAVETRSEFRYRIEAAAPQQTRAVVSRAAQPAIETRSEFRYRS
jgi:hypothetical protein